MRRRLELIQCMCQLCTPPRSVAPHNRTMVLRDARILLRSHLLETGHVAEIMRQVLMRVESDVISGYNQATQRSHFLPHGDMSLNQHGAAR